MGPGRSERLPRLVHRFLAAPRLQRHLADVAQVSRGEIEQPAFLSAGSGRRPDGDGLAPAP
jgi:hypothetical protein